MGVAFTFLLLLTFLSPGLSTQTQHQAVLWSDETQRPGIKTKVPGNNRVCDREGEMRYSLMIVKKKG